MAIHITDSLSQVTGCTKDNPRLDNYLWLSLTVQLDYFDAENHGPQDRDYIATTLKNNKFVKHKELINAHHSSIPLTNFNWIKNNPYQWDYIHENLKTELTLSLIPLNPHIPTPSNTNNKIISHQQLIFSKTQTITTYLHGKDYVIATIDAINISNTDKIDLINKIERKWNDEAKWLQIFNWFDDDRKRISYTWDWMSNKYPERTATSKILSNIEDLKYFFKNNFISRLEREAIIEKIKKAWNQSEQRRKNTDTSQLNVVISKKSKESLDLLAKTQGISRNKIIENLIENELKKQSSIAGKLH